MNRTLVQETGGPPPESSAPSGLRKRRTRSGPPPAPSAERPPEPDSPPSVTPVTSVEALERTSAPPQEEMRETLAEIERRTDAAVRRIETLQRVLGETERDLAYTVERLQRENMRAGWMQTRVIALALLAGTLGGTAAALLILAWTG